MPDDIRKLAERILVNPMTVKVSNTEPVTSVDHSFYATEDSRKGDILESLLSKKEHESVLIFTRTKYKARNLAKRLTSRGYESTFLQGNMTQGQRQKALDGFRDGKFPIMVATDIAARGIDCDRITHVINFDMPDTVETYTHRIGRTGRAGRSGTAVSLVTRDDKTQVRAIERAMRISIEQCTFDCEESIAERARREARMLDAQPTTDRAPREGRRSEAKPAGNHARSDSRRGDAKPNGDRARRDSRRADAQPTGDRQQQDRKRRPARRKRVAA